MDQYCNYCKLTQHKTKFIRIVRRRNYNIDSDDDGYCMYMKSCKMCVSCRNERYFNQKIKNKLINYL